MFNLRIATLDDKEEVYAKCRKFYEQSPYSVFQFDPKATNDTIEQVLQMDKTEAICLLSKDGILAAKVVTLPFSQVRVSTELVWWMEPSARGSREALRLLSAYEYWADKVALCDACQMSALATLTPDKLDRLYQGKGYKKTDTSYLRILS